MTEATGHTLTRRTALRASTIALAALWLQACGGESSGGAGTGTTSGELTGPLRFANWPQNIDFAKDNKTSPTLRAFERDTQLQVRYSEAINGMNAWAKRLALPLQAGAEPEFDLILLDDIWTPRFLRAEWLEAFDASAVAQARANVDERYASSWDEDFAHHFPYTYGAMGLAYDVERTGRELTSVEDFFDPKFKGRVTLYQDWQPTFSTIALLLRERGEIDHTPDQLTVEDGEKIHAFLKPYVESGHIRRFAAQEYLEDLSSGTAWVALGVTGDIAGLGDKKIRFAYPEEGSARFTDHLAIPRGAEHQAAAERMIELIYDPQRAKAIVEWTGYPLPVKGVRELLPKEIADDELLFPSDAVLEKQYPYPSLSEEDGRVMDQLMSDLKGL